MKILMLTSLLVTLVKSQVCNSNCMDGPLFLPYYFCQCPLVVNPYLSTCIRHCITDTLCRLCYGDPLLGIPKLCPYTTNANIDLSTTDFGFTLKEGTRIFGLDQTKSTEKTFFDPVSITGFVSLFSKQLIINGKYNINGAFCEETPINKEGYLTISFEDTILDWIPELNFFTKCANLFIFVGNNSSNITITTSKRIKFDFKDNENKADKSLSNCVKYKWDEIFEKIKTQLESFFLQLFISYTNNIVLQIPFNEILSPTPIPLPTI